MPAARVMRVARSPARAGRDGASTFLPAITDATSTVYADPTSGLLGSLIDYRASIKRPATMRFMPPPTVPIAIVGFGSIARSHVTALRSLPIVRPGSVVPRIAAIVTDRPDEAGAEAASLDVDRVVQSLEEALTDDDIALVDVASRKTATRRKDAPRSMPVGACTSKSPSVGQPRRPMHSRCARWMPNDRARRAWSCATSPPSWRRER